MESPSINYHLEKSFLNLRGIRSDFFLDFFFQFFDEISLRKQNSARWDTTFDGITSGAMLFALYSVASHPRLYCLPMSHARLIPVKLKVSVFYVSLIYQKTCFLMAKLVGHWYGTGIQKLC